MRSITPSEAEGAGRDSDTLRSPLAKRKKLAADRSGASKLKEAITAEDIMASRRSTPARSNYGEIDDDMNEDEDENEDPDDFLARELEEDWG